MKVQHNGQPPVGIDTDTGRELPPLVAQFKPMTPAMVQRHQTRVSDSAVQQAVDQINELLCEYRSWPLDIGYTMLGPVAVRGRVLAIFEAAGWKIEKKKMANADTDIYAFDMPPATVSVK